MSEEVEVQPSRKKKWLVRGVIGLLVMAIVFYFVAHSVLNRVTRQAMLQLAVEATNQGAEVSQPSFESVRLNGFLGATWSGLRAEIQREMVDSKRTGRLWEAQVDWVSVDWDLDGQATLDAHGVKFIGTRPKANGKKLPERRIELEHLSCEFPLELLDPKAAVKLLLTNFLQLSKEGVIGLPLNIDGKIIFALKGKPTELRMQAVEQNGKTTVVFLREDVTRLSDVFEDKLSEAEIDLIAANARRAPRLLEIKDEAETVSSDMSQQNDSIPQDPYRHVLWSFLLTREYNAELAKQVGDAHEMGDTGNTEAERDMDLHNNAIGRKYAEDGVARSDLLSRFLKDPEVIREP
jgi:hypothetical protein